MITRACEGHFFRCFYDRKVSLPTFRRNEKMSLADAPQFVWHLHDFTTIIRLTKLKPPSQWNLTATVLVFDGVQHLPSVHSPQYFGL